MALSTDLFDYDLPAHLIAQTPAAKRDESRLLVVDRASRSLTHRRFADLPLYLGATDTLFRNNAAVLPARLTAQRPTGGAVECFLLRPSPERGPETWWCLVRPGKKLPVGATFSQPDAFFGEVIEKNEEGGALVRFTCAGGATLTEVANRCGEVPLPPYIERPSDSGQRATDKERYQTVYAQRDRQVAVAAPTAGLHFTPELLQRLSQKGVATRDVTLHVGLGTFRPISATSIEQHAIHREVYEVPVETQRAVFDYSRRRIAVGTTTVRSLEDFRAKNGSARATTWVDEAAIYLYPPRHFTAIDGLITNFHQPRSTLLCLVAAFLTPGETEGIAWLKEIYREAIAKEYRFFSYGDAMLIL